MEGLLDQLLLLELLSIFHFQASRAASTQQDNNEVN